MTTPINHVSRPVEHRQPERTPPPQHTEHAKPAESKQGESKPAEHVGRKVDVKA